VLHLHLWPCTNSWAVMRPDSFDLLGTIFLYLLNHFMPDVKRGIQAWLQFLCLFILCYSVYLWPMNVCFCCVRFSFLVLSQEIGWEERLQNDLFCHVGAPYGSAVVMHHDSGVDFGTIWIVCLCVYLTSFLTCFLSYFLRSLYFISYLFIFLLVYILTLCNYSFQNSPFYFR